MHKWIIALSTILMIFVLFTHSTVSVFFLDEDVAAASRALHLY